MLDGTGALLLLLGVLLEYNRRPVDSAGRTTRLSSQGAWSTLLPFGTVIIGAMLLLDLAVRNGHDEISGLIAVMFALTLLVIARQAITVRENARLSTVLAQAESETRFRSLVQHSADLITILDGADTIRYVSPAIARVFGHDASGIEGAALRDLVHPDDVVPMLGFLTDAAKPGSRASTSHWRMRSASGDWCRGGEHRRQPAHRSDGGRAGADHT